VFLYGLWDGKHSVEPVSTILVGWPQRAVLPLRASDIIWHFVANQELSGKTCGQHPLHVLQIGSGSAILPGLMTHALGSRHVLVDLPEQAAVGFSVLSEIFPNLRVLLPNELVMGETNIEDADIVFITPEQLDWLEQKEFEVAVNMFSFQEMSHDTISEYFELIRTHLKPGGIFYCMNRALKRNYDDYSTSEFANYPWSPVDEFLYDFTFDGVLADVKVAGKSVRESVVRLASRVESTWEWGRVPQ